MFACKKSTNHIACLMSYRDKHYWGSQSGFPTFISAGLASEMHDKHYHVNSKCPVTWSRVLGLHVYILDVLMSWTTLQHVQLETVGLTWSCSGFTRVCERFHFVILRGRNYGYKNSHCISHARSWASQFSVLNYARHRHDIRFQVSCARHFPIEYDCVEIKTKRAAVLCCQTERLSQLCLSLL